MRRIVLAATIAAAMTLTAPALAGGGGHGSDRCPGFAEGGEIVMLDSCFSGTAHFAPAYGQVEVVNEGQLPHTYTAVDGSFDSGILPPGESFSFSTKDAGLVEVFCRLHGTMSGDGMAGLLVVGAPGSSVEETAVLAAAQPAPPEQPPAELVAALDRQSEAIAELTAQEAALLGRLVSANAEPEGWPAPLTAVLVLAGLALAGIFLVTRAPGRVGIEQRVGQPERI